ncbi:MAG: hypothetical protein ACPGGG_08275 [Parvibaculales bacterium]
MNESKKDSTLLIKINKQEKKEFIRLCEQDDTTASREIRRFIKRFIREQGNSAQR